MRSLRGIPNYLNGPEMGNQTRQLFVPGPPKFIKLVSFPSAFRVAGFRLPVSGP